MLLTTGRAIYHSQVNLLTFDQVSLSHGHRPLLDQVDLQIARGERVCLVGRNGAGKSTLLRTISGSVEPDDGEIWRRATLRISHLEQEVPEDTPATIYDTVAAGLGDLGGWLSAYHQATGDGHEEDRGLDTLDELQRRIEAVDGWNADQKIATVLTRLSLPSNKRLAECSGGIRRRVLLAQALVNDPDLLLLDEPTNHMDIAAIGWLEEFLLAFQGGLIFVTHDRTLLQRVATRIIELDRGRLVSFPGDYQNFLRRKKELHEAEERANAKFDQRLSEHEVWIRKGIKARRTRNEGRVRRLESMRREKAKRMSEQGSVKLSLADGERSGKLVVEMESVTFGYADQPIIEDLSTRILRGDRVGIMGPNGCGKSTLLKLLLGELPPHSGKIELGTKLEAVYFDQQREQLDPTKTVRDNMTGGSDYVQVQGRARHVIGYLKDFLFPPDRIDSPVSTLSGGERNRLLLARLFTRSANLVVLDEPTNDLDVDTLELLEDLLADYEGTLLLVSHDRTFLDNVVTSTIVFEGDGQVAEYVGGYDDWLRQRPTSSSGSPVLGERVKSVSIKPTTTQGTNQRAKQKSKLGFNERRELDGLPAQIEALEEEQRELEVQVSGPEFYRQDKSTITRTLSRLDEIAEQLSNTYTRWAELEEFEQG